MRFIRRNAIALTALVFAMTGTGIAASRYVITSTSQIKPSVVEQLRAPTAVAAVSKAGVYEQQLTAETPRTRSGVRRVLTLAVPPGTYSILGDATVIEDVNGNGSGVCTLTAGTATDRAYATTGGTAGGETGTVSTAVTHTFAGAGSVVMSCGANDVNEWQLEAGARIIAVRVPAEHATATTEASEESAAGRSPRTTGRAPNIGGRCTCGASTLAARWSARSRSL